jgi:GDPmannose 4,6-dehydratase
LLEKNYEVFGLIRGQNNPKKDLVNKIIPGIKLIDGDLTDSSSLLRALEISNAEEIYNLGAISFVAYSWNQIQLTSQVTALGVVNILEAIRIWAGNNIDKIKFYQASSSEMFGKVQETPQTERTLLWPRSPYGVAKSFGHHMTINFRESYGLHASSGILFNHESPRRGPEFVTRKISLGVAKIARGLSDQIVLGNLDAKRDWGFAGDYVEAMWKMLQEPSADDYVIATGETHSVREFVQIAFEYANLPNWEKYVKISNEFLRPAEVDYLVGNSEKARKKLNWSPKVSFKELVHMMVESDLELVTRN